MFPIASVFKLDAYASAYEAYFAFKAAYAFAALAAASAFSASVAYTIGPLNYLIFIGSPKRSLRVAAGSVSPPSPAYAPPLGAKIPRPSKIPSKDPIALPTVSSLNPTDVKMTPHHSLRVVR